MEEKNESSASDVSGPAGSEHDGSEIENSGGTEEENNKLIDKLTIEMTKAAKDLDFERAAEIRDIIIELKGKK